MLTFSHLERGKTKYKDRENSDMLRIPVHLPLELFPDIYPLQQCHKDGRMGNSSHEQGNTETEKKNIMCMYKIQELVVLGMVYFCFVQVLVFHIQ